MRPALSAALLVGLLSSAALCAAEKTSVLFIGNSFTYVNDMPGMFSKIARSLGHEVEVDMLAPGGYGFGEHARDPKTQAKLGLRKWSFVALQDQSQRPAFPDGQFSSQVLPEALRLGEAVHAEAPEANTVFFETWGYKSGDRQNCSAEPEVCTYDGMQNRLSSAYSEFARKSAGRVVPVGRAWRKVRLTHPEIELYAGDGIHPSSQGSYLAACVFYSFIFRTGFSGADPLGLEPAQASILQKIAQEAVFHPSPK